MPSSLINRSSRRHEGIGLTLGLLYVPQASCQTVNLVIQLFPAVTCVGKGVAQRLPFEQSEKLLTELKALGQCIPPPRHGLTSAALRIRIPIRIRIRDPDRHQNLVIFSLAYFQPSLKMSCKSVWKFLRIVANRQTDRQTDKQRRKHNLLGGGKNRQICIQK